MLSNGPIQIFFSVNRLVVNLYLNTEFERDMPGALPVP